MDINHLILQETARRDIYKGLSACYYIPEMGLVTRVEKMVRQLAFLGSTALASAVLMQSELPHIKNLEMLKREFARLFIGPYHLPAPPYGSIYLDGNRKIMGNSTIDVRRRYIEGGLSLADTFKDAPDHIAAELEFMYVAIFNELKAIQSDEAETVYGHLYRQKSFLQDHIGAWVAEFSDRVLRHAELGFYRHLADVTHKFIIEELEAMGQLEIPEPMENAG